MKTLKEVLIGSAGKRRSVQIVAVFSALGNVAISVFLGLMIRHHKEWEVRDLSPAERFIESKELLAIIHHGLLQWVNVALVLSAVLLCLCAFCLAGSKEQNRVDEPN